MENKKIYLASSWKNEDIVKKIKQKLKQEQLSVYDFTTDSYIFNFDDIERIQEKTQLDIMDHPFVETAFRSDFTALQKVDVVLLILPCGRSAHLEAGYAKGNGKTLIIYQPNGFPVGEYDVMYLMADLVTDDFEKILDVLKHTY